MKKILSAFLAVMIAFVLTGIPTDAHAARIADWDTYELISNEIQTFNIHVTQRAADLNVLTNCVDGLLTHDERGELIGNAACAWNTHDDGKTWTFHLKHGMKWVDYTGQSVKADVTAQDWLWGLEWILNAAKNPTFANTAMPMEMIAGAREYFEYTRDLASRDEEAALSLGLEQFCEIVQVSAPDEYTLVYGCTDELTYFPTLAACNCLYPVAGALLDEIGAEGYRSLTYDVMWYNGPYTVTQFEAGVSKTLTANAHYHSDSAERFDSVTVHMVDSPLMAYRLFESGILDHVTLDAYILRSIYGSAAHENYQHLVEMRPTKYSYQLHFNYDKRTEDGGADMNWNRAAANEAFRLSLYYGLDLTEYFGRINPIDPLSCENYGYTARGVALLSDGTDYADLVREMLGIEHAEQFARVDEAKADAYREQAMRELSAQGVTFPVELSYYVPAADRSAHYNAEVLQKIFAECLGEEYIRFVIKTYESSLTDEVCKKQLASVYIDGWGADFGDPINFLAQETLGEPNAYYSQNYSMINGASDPELLAVYEEFTRRTNEAKAITGDTDARLRALAEAEVYLLEKALCIPVCYAVRWQLTCADDYTKPYAAYGIQNGRYVGWETDSSTYPPAEYARIRQEYEAQ